MRLKWNCLQDTNKERGLQMSDQEPERGVPPCGDFQAWPKTLNSRIPWSASFPMVRESSLLFPSPLYASGSSFLSLHPLHSHPVPVTSAVESYTDIAEQKTQDMDGGQHEDTRP